MLPGISMFGRKNATLGFKGLNFHDTAQILTYKQEIQRFINSPRAMICTNNANAKLYTGLKLFAKISNKLHTGKTNQTVNFVSLVFSQ